MAQEVQFEHIQKRSSAKNSVVQERMPRGVELAGETADLEMDLEPQMFGNHGGAFVVQQTPKTTINYYKLHKMVKSHVWSQRAQALEDFLRYLIEMQPSQLMAEF